MLLMQFSYKFFRQGLLKVTDDDYCLMKCDAVYSDNLFTHVSEKPAACSSEETSPENGSSRNFFNTSKLL